MKINRLNGIFLSRYEGYFFILILFSLSVNCGERASAKKGEEIFRKYCVVCHGSNGEGNGPLAAGKNPPPANLKISQLTDSEKIKIIKNGGAFVGRSPVMPAWREELQDLEIESLVLFINSLRSGR